MQEMASSLHATFLENVRRRMDELEMSQRDLARSMDVSDAYVSQVLRGQTKPGPDGIEKFAKALRCNWLYLVTPVEPAEISASGSENA